MTELIGEIFSKIFNDNVILATIFVSMVPIMELKGGIPFGMSEAFWGINALGRWQAFWWAYLGCSIVVVGLYFAFTPIMKFLRKTKVFKGLANFIDNRIKKQSQKYQQEDELKDKDMDNINIDANISKDKDVANKSLTKAKLWKMFGVFCFVAIPLPLTGVWMGVCIAVMLKLKFWETLLSVQIGNLIAGIIISTLCVLFPSFTHWLIYIFVILVVVFILFEIIKNKINKNNATSLISNPINNNQTLTSYECYTKFVNSNNIQLLGTARDLFRIKNLESIGRFSVNYEPVSTFTDLIQYLGKTTTNKEVENFIDYVMNDNNQCKLSNLSLFSTKHLKLYNEQTYMAMENALKSCYVPNIFTN